jgi:tRNA(Ile)-lysidine synthase TilS/MesJ
MRHLLQVELVVAHCDHAIREDSSANAAWVQRLAAGRWGVPCHVVTAQQDLRKEVGGVRVEVSSYMFRGRDHSRASERR